MFPGERPPEHAGYLFSFGFCCAPGILASRWWLAGALAVLGWLRFRMSRWPR